MLMDIDSALFLLVVYNIHRIIIHYYFYCNQKCIIYRKHHTPATTPALANQGVIPNVISPSTALFRYLPYSICTHCYTT